MAEQEIQVIEEQTRQKELNDVNQNKSNDRKVMVEDENSEGDKSGKLGSKNDTTNSIASTGETVEVAISTKKIKNNPNPNTGPKKDDGDDPYDPYVNNFNFIQNRM